MKRWVATAVFCLLAERASAVEAGSKPAGPPRPSHDWFRGHFSFVALTAEPFGPGPSSFADYGYGAGFSLGAGYARIPLTVGADVMAVAWSRTTTRNVVLLDANPTTALVTRSDRTVFYDLWLRVEPPYLWLRPYVEGVVGLKGLYTSSSLRLPGGTGETSVTTRETPTFSAGFGAGVDVRFAENRAGAAAYASIGVRRLYGGRASFVGAFDTDAVRFSISTNTTLVTLGLTAIWDFPLPSTTESPETRPVPR